MKGPKVKWADKIGNEGEALISLSLSRIALVTSYDKDFGIDFYCEALLKDSPTTYTPGKSFYVQAKGTEHFDERGGASISKTTLKYWLDRPSPVYLFVGDTKAEKTYWFSIEEKREWLYQKIIESDAETIYLKIDVDKELNKENFEDFNKQLESDIKVFYINMGIPQLEGEGYVKSIPIINFSETQRIRTFERVCHSILNLILSSMYNGDYSTGKRLSEGLIVLGYRNAISYLSLAQCQEELNETDESLHNYKETLRVINEDKDFLAEEKGLLQKKFVEKKIKEVSEKVKALEEGNKKKKK